MLDKAKTPILVLVEGERMDAHVMDLLLEKYGIAKTHKIVSYNTNIYTLYNAMFKNGNPDDYDLLSVLKEREHDEQKKLIFDVEYSDIILVFDLDPQDPVFEDFKIREMLSYFNESTDKGKLYLNYPMIESFYHMKSIPDVDYNSYYVTLGELYKKLYKDKVKDIAGGVKLSNIDFSKEQCNVIIRSNVEKAWSILGKDNCSKYIAPDANDVLDRQLMELKANDRLWVLSTCPYYIIDYNPKLIM